MKRFVAFSFALGSAAAALSGCIAAPATGDDTGEAAQAVDVSLSGASLDKSTASASQLASKLATAPRSVPPLWTFDNAKECARYDVYTSALAEYTIACTGTIGPSSFAIDNGVLRRKFDECAPRKGGLLDATIEDIDDLLSLQGPVFEKDLVPNADGTWPWPIRRCFTEPWQQWTKWLADRFAVTSNASCPAWSQVATDPLSDERTFENAAEFGKIFPDEDEKHIIHIAPEAALNFHMPKENYYYVVRFPVAAESKGRCETPELCGNACSNGLAGFYVNTKRVTIQFQSDNPAIRPPPSYTGLVIVGDPLWWMDPTLYAVDTSPYLAADYYHPMSFYRALPGARYAHKNRAGEKCSYYCYDSGYHMIGQLVPDCVDDHDPSTCTMTHCNPLPVTSPTPSSGSGSL